MKVVFISNFISHHQKPFCEAMLTLLGNDFVFIATAPMDSERLEMGWRSESQPYVLRAYESKQNEQTAKHLARDADAVIIGSAPDSYMIPRLKSGKLTFKYAERFYKKGLTWKTIPRAVCGSWLHHGRFQRYPLYMLCASAYTASDCAVFGNYLNRTFRWGYFPSAKIYDMESLMEQKRSNKTTSMLWAGRFIGWKHPESSILLAERLLKSGYDFELNLIGTGVLEAQLQNMILEKGLSDCVHMLGAMSPDEVRTRMEQANIFLFTSDFNEGWGAVLNESMNSGCAVVASHAIGSVPFLLRDGENGLIYRNGDLDDLYKKVSRLLDSPEVCTQLGRNAYQTIVTMWNPETAAKRFVQFAEHLRNNNPADLFMDDGPCSKAGILPNDWY